MRKVWVAIGAVALLGGIGYYVWSLKNEANKLMNYCIKFKDVKVISLDRKKIVLEAVIDFKNRSKLSIRIFKYDFEVLLNGVHATRIVYDAQKQGTDKKPIDIAPNGFSPITLGIEIIPVNELANWSFLSNILFDLNNTRIGFKGVVSAKAAGIKAENIKIDTTFKLKEFLPDKNAPKVPEQPCI
jgi:hypothetical protein